MKNKFEDPRQLRKYFDERAAQRLAEKKQIEEEAAALREVKGEAKRVGSLRTVKTDDGVVLSKAESQEKRDIVDAYQLAESFSENKGKEQYSIKEGFDLFDIIHSLVVLWRRCKALEKLVAQLDKGT
jgi:hypothetical protein